MSFWNFLGVLAWWEWLSGSDKPNEVKTSSSSRPYDYGREDEYFDKVQALERRIDELEQRQEQCDIYSDRYDELQDQIDDLQDELDELDDYFDDDL